jgi:hypothetical protein
MLSWPPTVRIFLHSGSMMAATPGVDGDSAQRTEAQPSPGSTIEAATGSRPTAGLT